MKVKQFVMAYRADHENIKSLLKDGFTSLRPVLRINVEIIAGEAEKEHVRIEWNTPVAAEGKRGWLNLHTWESADTKIDYEILQKHVGERTAGSETAVKGVTFQFKTEFLTIEYTGVGLVGGCPAEDDNDGCFYLKGDEYIFVESESIDGFKEYCDCAFQWTKPYLDGMKLPAEELLGAYKVEFDR